MLSKKIKKWAYILWSVKWWLLLFLVGIFVVIIGLWTLVSTNVSRNAVISFVNFCERIFPVLTLNEGILLFLGGSVLAVVCLLSVMKHYLATAYPHGKRSYYQTKRLYQGPRVVVIGGGSGLATLLRGLKEYTCNITAAVTVGDDGGSSGRLREEYDIIPLGDIRNCVVALSDKEELMEKLFDYRFSKGNELGGHSLGNLLLLAMSDIEGDVDDAMENLDKIFQIRGRVLPIANEPMTLKGILADGSIVYGETNVRESAEKIAQIELEPMNVTVNHQVLQAIDEADAIILGPGSLYTSIIPNLLVEQVAEHIKNAKCSVYYICNITTEKGETDDYGAQDHLKALEEHSLHGLVDYMVVNDNLNVADDVLAQDRKMVDYDVDELYRMGVNIIADDFVSVEKGVCHNSEKLAQVLIENICNDYAKGEKKGKYRFRKNKADS